MIARVAEHCFWLFRYLERAEDTARLLQVNRAFELDIDLPPSEAWKPVLHAAGELPAFTRRFGAAAREDPQAVQQYLAWDESCGASIHASLHLARENARTIRDAISLEMWRSMNTFWLWFTGREGRALYTRDRHAFYERVKEGCQLFHGQTLTTMLHEEPFAFMRMGGLLERAVQTLRMVDASVSRQLPRDRAGASPHEGSLWLAALRSCSASEAFAKRNTGPLAAGPAAVFLLHDDAFPRSVTHCLDRAARFLDFVTPADGPPVGRNAHAALRQARAELASLQLEWVTPRALGPELRRLVDGVHTACDRIRDDFFQCAIPVDEAAA
ncbi:MAG: alpha-E domain-containing protein [Gemmatimonadales bacterium]|nr:alpha-E domain-containing protein [Gemmatimonadales bacterium]